MSLDLAIGLGISDASENEAVAHLIVVEERLIRLVNLATDDLASARAARSGSARVWQVEAGLLGGVEHVGILIAFDHLLAIWSDEGDLVGHHHHVRASRRFGGAVAEVILLNWEGVCTSDREAGRSDAGAGEHLDVAAGAGSHLGLGGEVHVPCSETGGTGVGCGGTDVAATHHHGGTSRGPWGVAGRQSLVR